MSLLERIQRARQTANNETWTNPDVHKGFLACLDMVERIAQEDNAYEKAASMDRILTRLMRAVDVAATGLDENTRLARQAGLNEAIRIVEKEAQR